MIKQAKYKFTLDNETYYVTDETKSNVIAQGKNGERIFPKDRLQRLAEQGQVDFSCDTMPNFLTEDV